MQSRPACSGRKTSGEFDGDSGRDCGVVLGQGQVGADAVARRLRSQTLEHERSHLWSDDPGCRAVGQSLVDATYRALGYRSNDNGRWV